MSPDIMEEIARLRAENEELMVNAVVPAITRPVSTVAPQLAVKPDSFSSTPASLEAWNAMRPRSRGELTDTEKQILDLRIENMNLASAKSKTATRRRAR